MTSRSALASRPRLPATRHAGSTSARRGTSSTPARPPKRVFAAPSIQQRPASVGGAVVAAGVLLLLGLAPGVLAALVAKASPLPVALVALVPCLLTRRPARRAP